MPEYHAPLRDLRFVLRDVLRCDAHYERIGAAEASAEVVDAVLDEAAHFCEERVAPLYQSGDQGCRFVDGEVLTPPGFRDAYKAYADAGWPGISGPPEYGGQGLPESLSGAVAEIAASANLAWFEYPGLCEGAINTLREHGSDELRTRYLPRLISGEWLGTMCLTEPHCGSDLSLLRTQAEPAADGGYALSGTKIFISSGEHDMTDNIVHIVLARLPQAPLGTRGISLFLVPKILPDGSRNGVRCGGIEHKMGIRGSATAVLNFEAARAYLLGPPHQGLKCMFTFMNYARVGAARLGVCTAERAFQGALAYARERLAGRAPSGAKYPHKAADPIVVHPDVRRMLLTQKAIAEGGRAFVCFLDQQVDLSRSAPSPAERESADRLLSLLTPIAKGCLTELGCEAANLGIQIFGGHGYIAEYGMEQIVRDARIATIWEGTTGIQALDLAGRKVLASDGVLPEAFWSLIEDFCDRQDGIEAMAYLVASLRSHLAEWRDLTVALIEGARSGADEIGAASFDYLMYSGYVVLAYFWARMAATALEITETGALERDFCAAKWSTARFFHARILPRAAAHRRSMLAGADSLMELHEDQLWIQ